MTEERAVDDDLLQDPDVEEQQQRKKKHCWEIIKGFTLDTRPDLPECPRQYQHFFLSKLLDWVAEQEADRDWDKEQAYRTMDLRL